MAQQRDDAVERTSLHQKIDHLLIEARVILPGAQALLGFQLAIVLTEAFAALSPAVKLVHGAALCCSALSIILLMALAAYHRIAYDGEDVAAFHRTGSRYLTVATLPLALSLSCDVFVVGTRIVGSSLAAAGAAFAVLGLLVGCWIILPLIARQRRSGQRFMGSDTRAPTPIG